MSSAHEWPQVLFIRFASSQRVVHHCITCFREVAFGFSSLAEGFSALQAPCIKPESLQFHTTWPPRIDYSQPPHHLDTQASHLADDTLKIGLTFTTTLSRTKAFDFGAGRNSHTSNPTYAYSSCQEFVSAFTFPGTLYHNY